jgi:hypothetical protein
MIRLNIYLTVYILIHFIYISIEATELKEAKKNYAVLHELYINWNEALYGLRTHHRNRLYSILTEMIGKEIETGVDYRILIPDVFEKKYFDSDLNNAKWLYIHGNTDQTSIKSISEKGDKFIKEVERNKYLFSLSGKIQKFRLVETSSGRSVHLYLESVKLHSDIK